MSSSLTWRPALESAMFTFGVDAECAFPVNMGELWAEISGESERADISRGIWVSSKNWFSLADVVVVGTSCSIRVVFM